MKPEKKAEKRKEIEIMNKGDVYKPKKRTYKDMLDNFEPLTEEQQKDLLFLMLDSMDFFEEGMKKATIVEDRERIYEHYSAYRSLVNFFVKDPDEDEMTKAHFALKRAHCGRLEWEKLKKHEKDRV